MRRFLGSRRQPRRHKKFCLCLLLSAVAAAAVVPLYVRRAYLASDQASLSAIPQATPPPLPHGGFLHAFTAEHTATLAADDFLRPRVVEAVAIPCGRGYPCSVQLFALTQGLCLPAFGYELRILGCLVGPDVYPLVTSYSGVYECRPTRAVRPGEKVSVVVERNEVAERVRLGTVRLKGISNRTPVDHGDFAIAPDGLEIHPGGHLDASKEMLIAASSVRWTYRDSTKWNGESMADSSVQTTVSGGVWMDPLPREGDAEGRYETCMMTQEKTSTEDVPHWVEYHRKLGVDMVYIYDNTASGNSTGLRAMFDGRADVEVIPWPHVKSQLTAQAHMLALARRRCEWLLLTDVDEWVMASDYRSWWSSTRQRSPLKRYLESLRHRRVDSAYLRERHIGPSGHHFRPKVPMPEAYTHVDKTGGVHLGKPLVRTDAATPKSRVHTVEMRPGATLHNVRFTAAQRSGDASLVHFKRRSWEDWVRKGHGGRGSIMVEDWGDTRGGYKWRAEEPEKGWLDTARDGRDVWTGFRDAWRSTVASRADLPPQVVVRLADGWRCARDVGREGYLSGEPVCERAQKGRADAASAVHEAAL